MPTEDELTEFFYETDADNSGVIEYPEFVTLMAKHRCDSEEDLRLAFDAFDENGDNVISCHELSKFVAHVAGVTLGEFETIIEDLDVNGTGFIGYDDFVLLMKYF
jgi:calmodulin